jgi:precorrin-4 methylase
MAKKQDNLNENRAAILDSNKKGGKVVRVTTGDMSPRLQDVFDRLRRLK